MSTFALHFDLCYHPFMLLQKPTSNYSRFSALLTPQQADALAAVKGALQDDPTCLDTHHSGCALPEQEDKKEVIDGN